MAIADLFDLSGRSAIVTGGGAGLGRVFAEAIAEAGANVAVCGRREDRCIEVAEALTSAYGVRAFGMRCDVRSSDEIDAVVARSV